MESVEAKHFDKEYIEMSHARCIEYGVEKERVFSKRILQGEELEKRLAERQDLIETAELYMKHLYDFVKGSDFFSLLTDEEGCILSIIGDETILSEALSFKMHPGAFMDEKNIGTNAMGTAIVEGKPVQVSGDEHFIYAYHRWTCSASPIKNSKGEIIGTIDLTGYSESVNLHTLGMTVAAANAIEEILAIKRYTEEIYLAKKFSETIIESMESGIITVNLNGTIKTVNQYVADLFGYSTEKLKTLNVASFLEGWNEIKAAVEAGNSIIEEEIFIDLKKKKMAFSLSAYPHINGKRELMDIIFVFKEIKKVRKLANKIAGHQAFYTFDKIIGKDKYFLQVINYAKKIADSTSNVLIMGESGTGKELYAQSIHNYSSRCDEPFVTVNCCAIPRELIESELFGYDAGAFTGAKSTGKPGKFEIADGGTIFLDEIGEMPLDMQTRLLRVLEEGRITRVGGVKAISVDARIIAATNKELNEEVRKGNFRKDLYYRLNVLPIKLMPLRERKDDIPLLCHYFMESISQKLGKRPVEIDEDTMNLFMEYEWPGNVRELENMIELMVNAESVPVNFPKDYRGNIERNEAIVKRNEGSLQFEKAENVLNLEIMERRHIVKVLDSYQGNVSLAAKALGIGRNTLYRKMEAYKIK